MKKAIPGVLTRPFSVAIALDIAERAVVVPLYIALVVRMLDSYLATGHFVYLMNIISEGMIGAFVLLRRTTHAVSVRPMDWVITASGTFLPLMVTGGGKPLVPAAVTLVIMLVGFAISSSAKLWLRRSFGLVAANRGVKKGGPYRFVRHPMYLGYLMTQIGFFLFNPTLWNLAVYAVSLVSQIARIWAEERILMQDADYQVHAHQVRYRLVPGVF